MGTGLCSFRVQKAPEAALWKLENEENWWNHLVQIQSPENRESTGVSARVWSPENQELWCPRTGKDGDPSSRRETEFALPSPFCSIQTTNRLHDAHPTGEDRSLYSVYWIKCQSLPETQKHPERMFYRLAGHPLAQSSWYIKASLLAQMVKNLPAMRQTWVWSLSQKEPLEKGMAIHSSILAWRIPWTEKPDGLQSRGRKEPDTTEQLTMCPLSTWHLCASP